MNKNWKSEIKWFVLSAIVAFSIFWLLIAQFQNYNWTLSPQYSDGLWNLGLVFYFLCLTAGLVYFIRFMFNGQRIRLIKILAVIFPGIGIFCFLRASWILKNLESTLQLPPSAHVDPTTRNVNSIQIEILYFRSYAQTYLMYHLMCSANCFLCSNLYFV